MVDAEDGGIGKDVVSEDPTYEPKYEYKLWTQADHHYDTSSDADEIPDNGYKPWRIKSYFSQQPINPYTGSTSDCYSEQGEYWFEPWDNINTYYNDIQPASGDSNVSFSLSIGAAYDFFFISAGASVGVSWDLSDITVDDTYNGKSYNVHWTLYHGAFPDTKDYAGVEVDAQTSLDSGQTGYVDVSSKWGYTYNDPGTSQPVYTETLKASTTVDYTSV